MQSPHYLLHAPKCRPGSTGSPAHTHSSPAGPVNLAIALGTGHNLAWHPVQPACSYLHHSCLRDRPSACRPEWWALLEPPVGFQALLFEELHFHTAKGFISQITVVSLGFPVLSTIVIHSQHLVSSDLKHLSPNIPWLFQTPNDLSKSNKEFRERRPHVLSKSPLLWLLQKNRTSEISPITLLRGEVLPTSRHKKEVSWGKMTTKATSDLCKA